MITGWPFQRATRNIGTPTFLIFRTFWEASTQENLTPEASDRPETRLELLTRISSVRFVPHFLISSRIKQETAITQLDPFEILEMGKWKTNRMEEILASNSSLVSGLSEASGGTPISPDFSARFSDFLGDFDPGESCSRSLGQA